MDSKKSALDDLTALQASPTDALHHLTVALLTNLLAWLAIYNTSFDPLRLLPPKSLLLTVAIIPLSVLNTRLIGQRKWHFTSFEVAPFFNPNLSKEILLSFFALLLAVCRNSNTFLLGKWTDGVLRLLPVYFTLVQIVALTPILSDRSKQSVLLWAGTMLDSLLYIGMTAWGVGYGSVLAWRGVWWTIGVIGSVLRSIGKIVGLS